VVNYGADTVTGLRASDGSAQGTFTSGTNPAGAAFDGTYIWVANGADNTVSKLLASNDSNQGRFPGGWRPIRLLAMELTCG
jgi:DNA-binding beta-propeller fold protein YncE